MSQNLTSQMARQGERVTIINRHGGVGIGFLVDGQVWVTTGSVYAVRAEDDVCGINEFIQDGGKHYFEQVNRLGIFHKDIRGMR